MRVTNHLRDNILRNAMPACLQCFLESNQTLLIFTKQTHTIWIIKSTGGAQSGDIPSFTCCVYRVLLICLRPPDQTKNDREKLPCHVDLRIYVLDLYPVLESFWRKEVESSLVTSHNVLWSLVLEKTFQNDFFLV